MSPAEDEWGALGAALDRIAAVVDALDDADREGFTGRPNWIRTDVIRNIVRPQRGQRVDSGQPDQAVTDGIHESMADPDQPDTAAIRAEHEAHNYRVSALRNPHDCDGCGAEDAAKWDVLWFNEDRDEEPFLCDACLAREFREIRLCDALDAARAQVDQWRWAEALTGQQCPKGLHPDWFMDTEHNLLCPWCRIGELGAERDAMRAKLDAALRINAEHNSAAGGFSGHCVCVGCRMAASLAAGDAPDGQDTGSATTPGADHP